MDPNNMPAFGQFNAQADLSRVVAQTAPLADTWHGISAGVTATPMAPTTRGPGQGVLPAFWGKLESIGSEAGHIAAGAANWLGTNALNIVKDASFYRIGEGFANSYLNQQNSNSLTQQNQQLTDSLNTLTQGYKSGTLSKSDYLKGMKEFNQDSTNLMTNLSNFQSKVGGDEQAAVRNAIGSASAVATIISLGVVSPEIAAGEKAAASLLSSATELTSGANVITSLATDEAAWKSVTPLAQQVMKIATSQVLEAAGKGATADQIAKSVAIKMLLEYPLTYNQLSGAGTQVYDQLNNNKYGDAVKTTAFNAAMLMSGGIIGWGLKNAGKGAEAVSVAMGLRPGSILDELSSRIGTGDRNALAQIAQDAIKNGNESDVKSMIVALESNLKAANGNASRAVNLITDHLENYVGWGSMKNMDHQQAWDNIVNYWKHAEGLNDLKKAGEITGIAADDLRSIVPGRFTTQDKNLIATTVTQGDTLSGATRAVTDVAGSTQPAVDAEQQATKELQNYNSPFTKGKASVPGNAAVSYTTGNSNLDGIINDSIISVKGTASTAAAREAALIDSGISKDVQTQIRNIAVKNVDKSTGAISEKGIQAIHEVLSGNGAIPKDVQGYMSAFGVDAATATKELSAQTVSTTTNAGTTVADRLKAWNDLIAKYPNAAFANNPNVAQQVTQLIKDNESEKLYKAIMSIETQVGLKGIPKDYAKIMAKDGYIAIIPETHNLPVVPFAETTGKLATRGAEGDFFVHAGTPIPVLKSVGAGLVAAGLSPEVATQRVGQVFEGELAKGLSDMKFLPKAEDAQTTAKDLISKLSNYAKAPEGRFRLPVTDLRQLTTNDVVKALGVTRSEAKTVQDAILQAHLDVPLAIKGLGTQIMDANFKYNPLAAPYSKLQGAARFSWNPIFENGRLPLKAEFLSQMQTGGKFPTVAGTNTFMRVFFPGKYAELDSIAKSLTEGGLLPGGIGAEAADITGSTIAAASHYPKNAVLPVAGVIADMAKKVGLDSETFIKQFPSQVTDAATAILHYDRNANFLNSPMARTLNFAFFPFRFNVKVGTFMAKAITQQEPIVQYAVVKGMMNASAFLKSPDGQAWYSQNSDVIGLFKYFSPLETLSTIGNALQLKHDSVSQYGELGGLPFGWIPLMLDSVGLTHFGQAFVNPKTGVIAKDYVPTSAYGALNAAIQDLLSSLFTYPGAVAGLPSKSSKVRSVVGGLLPGSKNDFKTVDPTNLTPQDQQFSQTVQKLNGTETTPSVDTPPPLKGVKVPVQPSPLTTPRDKATSNTNSRKKKADFTPALLPGQTTLGQL
jgi:hypothetical protein